jgi:hypothetical protein
MEIGKSELQAIVKTLPIGLYAKRGIVIAIEDTETSYYSPNTDEIVVSYPQIVTSLKKVAEDSPFKESIIRGILYHEVSHAFMTPEMSWNDIINVFEDERMETLLADYYLNVDFKSNVFRFNGLEVGQVPPATDAFTAFYNAVRFRTGSAEMLRKIAGLIQKYATLTKANNDYSCNYYYDVMDLYREIEKDYWKQPQEYQGNGSTGQNGYNGDIKGESTEGQGKETAEGECGTQQDYDPNSIGRNTANEGALDPEQVKEMIADIIESANDPSLVSYFQTIISNFNKKNSKGSSINGYSGVLNPRLADRPDYKMFERPFTQKANNSFGTFHLNLFIDKSGSFWNSQTLVNKILSALSIVEKQNPNFTLDVVFCGYGEKVVESPRGRILKCGGGNDLDNDIYDIYRKLQKPNTYNYNIVLFDGDAFSSGNRTHNKNFRAFDFSNCTIISDQENERYIKKSVNRARVIYTKEYTNELLDNVCKAISKAFR